MEGTSLQVQWLGLLISMGSIPGQGTKISQAPPPKKKWGAEKNVREAPVSTKIRKVNALNGCRAGQESWGLTDGAKGTQARGVWPQSRGRPSPRLTRLATSQRCRGAAARDGDLSSELGSGAQACYVMHLSLNLSCNSVKALRFAAGCRTGFHAVILFYFFLDFFFNWCGPFFKSLLDLLQYCSCCFFIYSGILVMSPVGS